MPFSTTLLLLSIEIISAGAVFYLSLRFTQSGYLLNLLLIMLLTLGLIHGIPIVLEPLKILPFFLLPVLLVNVTVYALYNPTRNQLSPDKKFKVKMILEEGNITVENLRRGVSVIGAAGSGKTESVILNLLHHFSKHHFCGIIHDYKHFELTEMAYPLFKAGKIPFYVISFDEIYHRVNPIAPRYLPDEESVNEISRVLLENLLEQKDGLPSGTTKFFNDAVEGLISGLIWKMKVCYPGYCTIPHITALYQYLNTESLIAFLSTDTTAKAMAAAFINGIESERQTAAVKSTLANAFKKISTKRIFMALSEDQVPLDLNNPLNPAVISIVNNPKFETAYSPAIAAIVHTVIKQMSVRKREHSFILLEEAPTIRLLNMHRIPATLRSYDISTVYVLQDKIQNELQYGEKASRAILANLSYQFFGKVNDPDTAKYYERFFEIVKRQSISVNQGEGLDFDTRITKSEREVSKIRADLFFRLSPGEFVAFADGKEQKIKFRYDKILKELPPGSAHYSNTDIEENFNKIHLEIKTIFEKVPS